MPRKTKIKPPPSRDQTADAVGKLVVIARHFYDNGDGIEDTDGDRLPQAADTETLLREAVDSISRLAEHMGRVQRESELIHELAAVLEDCYRQRDADGRLPVPPQNPVDRTIVDHPG